MCLLPVTLESGPHPLSHSNKGTQDEAHFRLPLLPRIRWPAHLAPPSAPRAHSDRGSEKQHVLPWAARLRNRCIYLPDRTQRTQTSCTWDPSQRRVGEEFQAPPNEPMGTPKEPVPVPSSGQLWSYFGSRQVEGLRPSPPLRVESAPYPSANEAQKESTALAQQHTRLQLD